MWNVARMEKIPEPKLPREFILDAFADPASVRDVVRGILHTIFFHRYFPTIVPQSHEVLDLTLPYVAVPELETLIDARTAALVRELDSSSSSSSIPIAHQSHHHHQTSQSLPQQQGRAAAAAIGAFLGVGGGGANAATPTTTTTGAGVGRGGGRGQVSVQFMEMTRRRKLWYKGGDEEVCWESWTVRVTVAEPRTESERAKVRKAMESTLLANVMKVITSVNTYKDHIPPITIMGANPFPYSITVNQREAGLGAGGAGATAAGGGGGGGGGGSGGGSAGGGGGGGGVVGGWAGRFGGIY